MPKGHVWRHLAERATLATFLAVESVALAVTPSVAPNPGLARDILRELVEIRSTHDYGSTVAAKAVQDRLLAAGFAAQDALFLAPDAHPESGNVVARLHGRGKGKPVVYLCHLDVVEAKAEDWTRDPFRLTEDAG